MSSLTAEEILEGLGYHDPDRCFVSMLLTPQELNQLDENLARLPREEGPDAITRKILKAVAFYADAQPKETDGICNHCSGMATTPGTATVCPHCTRGVVRIAS